MDGAYRIFGSEMSPYSVKVRAYFRYKALPHVWIPRRAENDDEYRRYAKLPLIPLVVTPAMRGSRIRPRSSRPWRRNTHRLRSTPTTLRSASFRR